MIRRKYKYDGRPAQLSIMGFLADGSGFVTDEQVPICFRFSEPVDLDQLRQHFGVEVPIVEQRRFGSHAVWIRTNVNVKCGQFTIDGRMKHF